MDDLFGDYTIEVTYTAFGYEELGETTFSMPIKESEREWLHEAVMNGEAMDSSYISKENKGLHRRIIHAIHKDMKERSLDLNDGMVEESVFGIFPYEEYHSEASYEEMQSVDDDEIEYSVLPI